MSRVYEVDGFVQVKKSIIKGSYIVEATLILPIFMIAIMVIGSIISAYSCIEDGNYIS